MKNGQHVDIDMLKTGNITFSKTPSAYIKKTNNRPPPDTFISELYIYKPFEMNNMDSLPNRKLPKAISFYLVPR